jgi:dTDP-4-amino-4,6-dideoxygalactose transaminase
MPKSKHRKKPPVSKRTLQKIDHLLNERKRNWTIYDLARPEHQQYPPMITKPQSSVDRHATVITVMAKAEEKRQARNQKRLKNHIWSLAGHQF